MARDQAHVASLRLPFTEELAQILKGLEEQGLAFRGGGRFEVQRGKHSLEASDLLGLAGAVRLASEGRRAVIAAITGLVGGALIAAARELQASGTYAYLDSAVSGSALCGFTRR